ncbi:MAG: radical SAM protein [Candidatus Lokiarchaeota archaeon]|nr:radical SAM protein [Candidatus Lokiarchaeota archaeon]
MSKKSGYPIVFTSSATEMSNFKGDPFRAFMGGFPQLFTKIQGYPPVEHDKSGAKYAPYGLRKIQSVLLENGFSENDIAVSHPKYLSKYIGENTKILAISTMDALALAYVDMTYSSFLGMGEPTNAIEFRKLLMKNRTIKKYKPKIIVGGAGAWQIANKKAMEYLGVDHVILGEAELVAPDIFSRVMDGEHVPRIIKCKNSPTEEEIIPIKHAVIHGGVELSRGCGRNCQFCSPTMRNRREISLEKIIKEVEVNIQAGNHMITLISEDLLLYGCHNSKFIPNVEAVCELCEKIASYSSIQYIQPVHISLAAVSAAPDIIPRLTDILWDNKIDQIRGRYHIHDRQIMSAETGIETGSPRLISKYMRGKVLPFTPEQWPEIVEQSIGILNDNDWIPLASLLLDMPEETEEDTMKTLELVDDLRSYDVFLMPVLFVPLADCILRNARKPDWSKVSKASYELFCKCWEYNAETYKLDYLDNLLNKTLVSLVGGGLYLGYYRWKETRKYAKRLIMKISDMI